MATKKNTEVLHASGVVETRARNNQALKLQGDDDWYSTFRFKLLDDMVAGATVSFDYTVNSVGGKDYFNIVKDTMSVEKSAPRVATAGGGSATAKDVQITRQAALKVAGPLVSEWYNLTSSGPTELADVAQDVIEVAALLERYVFAVDDTE